MFDWDPTKNQANIEKHGISFSQAESIFSNEPLLIEPDTRKDYGEDRHNAFGLLGEIGLIAVGFTFREDQIRIFTARPASRQERRKFNEAIRS